MTQKIRSNQAPSKTRINDDSSDARNTPLNVPSMNPVPDLHY